MPASARLKKWTVNLIIRSVWREIKSQPAMAISMALTLFLGLLAFNSIDIIRFSISRSLARQSKILLAADLALTSRRPLNEKELGQVREVIGAENTLQEVWELYTMARGPNNSRLVQLKAIPETFPFYGELKLNTQQTVSSLGGEQKAWVHPELLTQMGLKIGDAIKIGDSSFVITASVDGDFVNSWKGLSLAPKVYIGLNQLVKTGLVKPGSTVSYNYLAKISDSDTVKTKFKTLNTTLKDPALRIYDDQKASQEIVTGLSAISDYLGLVAIVALFLAGIGVYFLFNGYMSRKRSEIAAYNSLGLARGKAVLIYGCYLATLGLLALLPTWLISLLLLPSVNGLIAQFIPFVVEPVLPLSVLAISFAIAFLAIGVATLSVLWRVHNLPAANLFRDERELAKTPMKTRLFFILLSAVMIWVLALYQSQSFRVSSFFVAGLGAVLLVLTGVGLAVIRLLGKNADRFFLSFRLALKSLSRQPSFSLFGLMAIGAAFFLTLLVPLIRDGLISEMRQPPGIVLPNLFLFDIQDEQQQNLSDLLSQKGFALSSLSPMVRARVSEINGVPFEKAQMPTLTTTREEDTEIRFRNRGVNLSFRDQLNDSESIIEGKFYSEPVKPQQEWAEVSVEKFFMEQLKLKMGDKVVFDVQGVPVKGVVTSVRSVRWNSFLPNFFILVQPGVLEDAPKTFLAAVRNLKPEEVSVVQNLIVDKFPNVSVVDVRRSVDRITAITQTMIGILEIMSYLCVVIGFVILIAVVYHHGEALRCEWDLLNLLGLSQAKVRRSHLLRMLLLSGVAGLVAMFASIVVSKVMLSFVFEVYVKPPVLKYIFLGMSGLLATVTVVSYLVYGSLRSRKV